MRYILGILVLAVILLAGKLLLSPRAAPAAFPGPVSTEVAAPMPATAAISNQRKDVATDPWPEPGEGAEPSAESAQAGPATAGPEAKPPEKSEIAWMDAWSRPIPEPDTVFMDMSQVSRGGKPVATPYVAPPPLTTGTYLTNADGTQSTVLGDIVVNADGSQSKVEGDRIVKPDGTLGVMVGNEVLWSDGSKSTR